MIQALAKLGCRCSLASFLFPPLFVFSYLRGLGYATKSSEFGIDSKNPLLAKFIRKSDAEGILCAIISAKRAHEKTNAGQNFFDPLSEADRHVIKRFFSKFEWFEGVSNRNGF
jgi:hypothetical protein